MIRAVTCWRLLLDDLVEFELLLLELFTVDAAHGGTNHRYPLLVVDEVGYIPFEPEAANLFFQLVSSRYERASLNADPGLVRQFEGVADHVGISKDTALDQALSAWIAEHSGKGSQIRWKATPATN